MYDPSTPDVRVEHPIDRPLFDAHGHRVQRVVRTAPWVNLSRGVASPTRLQNRT